MSLLPEPVLRLPQQLQILTNLVLLILTLIISFLAVWYHQRLALCFLSYELWKIWHTCVCYYFQTENWAERLLQTCSSTSPPLKPVLKDFVVILNPCGYSMLTLALQENNCCQLFTFHCPVPGNRSLQISSSCYTLTGISCWFWFWKENYCYQFFYFHYPVPGNRSADFIASC